MYRGSTQSQLAATNLNVKEVQTCTESMIEASHISSERRLGKEQDTAGEQVPWTTAPNTEKQWEAAEGQVPCTTAQKRKHEGEE